MIAKIRLLAENANVDSYLGDRGRPFYYFRTFQQIQLVIECCFRQSSCRILHLYYTNQFCRMSIEFIDLYSNKF